MYEADSVTSLSSQVFMLIQNSLAYINNFLRHRITWQILLVFRKVTCHIKGIVTNKLPTHGKGKSKA